MEQETTFTTLSAYVNTIRPILKQEQEFMVANNWLKLSSLDDMLAFYNVEFDIVNTAINHIRAMSGYKKQETKLFQEWYEKLSKLYEIHEERCKSFLKRDLSTIGDPDKDIAKKMKFRRDVSRELARMKIVLDKSSMGDLTTEYPRLKNDTPVSILFSESLEKHFPVIREGIEKRKEEFFAQQKAKKTKPKTKKKNESKKSKRKT